ncbi:MAG TPA: hypothetical protein VFU76_08940 [Terriglobales bacterium]|nr:hypothetical protein [Terriglobales bacterium]
MKSFLHIALGWTLLVSTAFAGVRFEAVTRGDDGLVDARVRAVVSGPNIRVEYLESSTGIAGVGEYMLSHDGGKTLYWVEPSTRTYSKYDTDAMMSAMGSMVQGVRGAMRVRFEAPKIEKLLEEDGGQVAGVPTRHYRYRTTYTASAESLGMVKTTTNTVEEDIWASSALSDTALEAWLHKEPAKTGDVQFDSIIAAEMGKVQGFPLKRITVTRSVSPSDHQEHVTRAEMEVLSLTQGPVRESEFQLPANYVEVKPRRE